jgi:hypothetical protein
MRTHARHLVPKNA